MYQLEQSISEYQNLHVDKLLELYVLGGEIL